MNRKWVALLSVAGVLVVATLLLCTQVTIFVIQPIGSVPEGRTLVISRLNNMAFIDSADALCERVEGGVSLICRGMAMATVADRATIYLRLHYSAWLYKVSTGGKEYER